MIREFLRERLTPERLPEGDTAPQWRLRDLKGAWHQQATHWSLLVFARGDDSEAEQTQLTELQDQRPALSLLDCQVYAVFPSRASAERAVASLGLSYPALVDERGEMARTWACTLTPPAPARVVPTTYLVNPAQRIRLANRGRPSIAAIARTIQALQQATRDGM